ncbi:MAG TPA: class I SAM-dependent methyltransferase [Acidimicrobiia bacterium]|nr:class I SAM-dependent methyltransferase [Acidimicrobiia bacterium]
MNERHLELCSSDEWADGLKRWILPSALQDFDLGDDVLEVGPGPGRTTDLLKEMTPRLTAVEVDPGLAAALAARMAGTNVEVVHADATDLPFEDGRFSSVVSFIMLHHVPTAELQDKLFAEVARVLAPGRGFTGCDSLDGDDFRELHTDDVCNPVPAEGLEARLLAAGFSEAKVRVNPYVMEFRARR